MAPQNVHTHIANIHIKTNAPCNDAFYLKVAKVQIHVKKYRSEHFRRAARANIFGKGWQVNANFMFFCLACFLFAFLVVSRSTLHFTKSIGFYTKSTPASPPPAVAVAVALVPHIVFDCGLCSSTRA